MNITQILLSKYPGTQWVLNGEDYDGLDWLDETPKPTEAELEALWTTVQYEVVYAQVEQARQQAYQQTADPLFFEYQRGDATEQEWLDAVQAVKDAHPYPEDVTTNETQ
jgi:hypothetical protein